MPKVGTDPSKPLQICLDFLSVHVVAFRLRYRKPEDDEPTLIAVGTHRDDERCHDVEEELSWGSVIDYRFLYADEADAEFEVEVSIQQDGEDVDCSPFVITGPGGEFGVEGAIDIVDDCEAED